MRLGSRNRYQNTPGKGAGLKIDDFESPRIRCFGVLFPFIEGGKAPYEATALESTQKWPKYSLTRPIFLLVLELVLKIRVAVRDAI